MIHLIQELVTFVTVESAEELAFTRAVSVKVKK